MVMFGWEYFRLLLMLLFSLLLVVPAEEAEEGSLVPSTGVVGGREQRSEHLSLSPSHPTLPPASLPLSHEREVKAEGHAFVASDKHSQVVVPEERCRHVRAEEDTFSPRVGKDTVACLGVRPVVKEGEREEGREGGMRRWWKRG